MYFQHTYSYSIMVPPPPPSEGIEHFQQSGGGEASSKDKNLKSKSMKLNWSWVGGIIPSIPWGEIWILDFSGIAPCGLFSTLCKNHLIFSSWFSRSIFRMAKIKMLIVSVSPHFWPKNVKNYAHTMHDPFHWEVDF